MKSKQHASAFSMPESFNREKILSKPLARSITIERGLQVDEENRTVPLSFSSDAPVYHWFGYLILDHNAGSARLDRLNQSGALLWAHSRVNQIGSVSDTKIENGKSQTIAKFSRVGLGAEKFEDVKDGICRTTSFGFFLYKIDPEVGNDGKQAMIDGEPVYRSLDWEPFEVSLEPIPADTSVGVARSINLKRDTENACPDCEGSCCPECGDCLDSECEAETCTCDTQRNLNLKRSKTTEKTMPDLENPNQPAPAAAAPVVENTAITRAREFTAYGEAFGEVDLARGMALVETNTLTDLGKAILEKRAASQTKVPALSPAAAAEREGQIIVQHRVGALKAFHGPNAEKDAYRSGMAMLAAFYHNATAIEYCRANGIEYNRTQTGSDNAKGGVFVIPEFEGAIIDLRILYGAFRRNADVRPMMSDTKIIHRRTGGLTAYAVGPSQRGTQSTATWDDVELVARKWMVLAKMEDELNEDSVINFADTLASEIAYAFTYAEDNAGFNGDGTSTYHGIVGVIQKLLGVDPTPSNIKGLKVASGNQWAEITRQDLLGVVGLLPQFARKSGNVKWYCSSEFWANVLEVIATAAGGVTYAEMNGELKEVFMGKPVEIIEVMPHTEANSQVPLLYGNLNQAAVMGDRRGVTIKMTDSNDVDFEQDLQTIKGTERMDINVHSVGDTANAGPIVGLITAAS